MQRFRYIISLITLVIFLITTFVPASYAQVLVPMPGVSQRVGASSAFDPALMAGVKVDPAHPLNMEFFISKGQENLSPDVQKDEYSKLLKYFLSALTVPQGNLWVNLSPVEKDHIISDDLAKTRMGMDLLSQDYFLKQLTASLLYPEGKTGKEFWAKVYGKAYETYGTTEIPVDTFNKVWIVPQKLIVYEDHGTAWVTYSHLKVMLESDYLEQNAGEVREPPLHSRIQAVGAVHEPPGQHESPQEHGVGNVGAVHEPPPQDGIAKQALRETIIPILEKEVNEGQNFAVLRQIVHAMALAEWYKRSLKETILGKGYADRSKMAGIDSEATAKKWEIYDWYVQAFKNGVFNYIKEEVDPATQEVIPRKYVSGGFGANLDAAETVVTDMAVLSGAELAGARAFLAAQAVYGLDRVASRFDSQDGAAIAASAPAAAPAVASSRDSSMSIVKKDYTAFGLKELATDYYGLKMKMLEALDKNQPEAVLLAYDQVSALVDFLSKKAETATDENVLDMIKGLLTSGAIDPLMVGGEMTQQGLALDAQAIRREWLSVGQDEFAPDVRGQVDQVVSEVIDELAKDAKDKTRLTVLLKGRVESASFRNMVPREALKDLGDETTRKMAAGMILGIPSALSAFGSYDPHLTKKVHLRPTYDQLVQMRATLKHELVHLLAHDNVIRIPDSWEDLTVVMNVVEFVTHGAKNVKEGEAGLSRFNDRLVGEVTVPLYEKGKQLGLEGASGFMINPGVSDRKAGYFSTDYLAMLVRQVYDAKGANKDILESSYMYQRTIGIMIAGILMGMCEKDAELKPLRLLKDFFDILWDRYSEDDNADVQAAIKLIEKDIAAYVGASVKLTPVPNGFFWQFVQGEFASQLNYVRTDLKPRFYDGRNRDDLEGQVSAARERGLGQAFLARNRMLFGFRKMINGLPENIRNHPAVTSLWDTLLFTRATGLGIDVQARRGEDLLRGSNRWVMRVLRDRYETVEGKAERMVVEALLGSLPMHLQFLDSILYRRYNFDPTNNSVQDIRLRNKEVVEAVRETKGDDKTPGWAKVLFRPDKMKEDDILASVESVWAAYEKLYRKDVEREEMWRAYQRKMREEKKEAMREAFEQALQNEEFQQEMQEYMEQLPQHARESLEKAAEEMMKEMQEQFSSGASPNAMPQPKQQQGQGKPGQGQPGQGQPSQGQPGQGKPGQGQPGQGQPGQGQPGQGKPGQGQQGQGQSGQGKPGQGQPGQGQSGQGQPGQGQPGQGQPGQGQAGQAGAQIENLKNIESMLQGLGEQLKNLEQRVGQVSQGLSQMKQTTQGMGSQSASELSGMPKEQRQAAGEQLQSKAGEVQNESEKLLNQGRAIARQGQNQNQAVEGVQGSLPSPEEGAKGVEQSAELSAKAQELLSKLEELQEKANQLNQAAGEVSKRLGSETPEAQKIENELRTMQQKVEELRQTASETTGKGREVNKQVHQLQQSLGALQGSLQEVQQKLAEQQAAGKAGKEGKEGKDQKGQQSGKPGQQGQPQAGEAGESQPGQTGKTSKGGGGQQSGAKEQGGRENGEPEEGPGEKVPASDILNIEGAGGLEKEFEGKAQAGESSAGRSNVQAAPIEFDAEAARQREEENIMLLTGLNREQYAELMSWYRIKIRQDGQDVSVDDLITDLTEKLDALALPVEGIRIEAGLKRGKIFIDPVEDETSDRGWANVEAKEPLNIKVAVLIDRSSSMGYADENGRTPIEMARINAFILSNALLNHNEKRLAKGFEPVEFSITLFNDNPEENPLISLAQVKSGSFLREKALYEMWNAMEPSGGTYFASNLKDHTEYLMRGMVQGDKTARLLIAMTDEDVDARQKAKVLGIMQEALDKKLRIFIVPFGSSNLKQMTQSLHAEHPEMILDPTPLAELPGKMKGAIVKAVEEVSPYAALLVGKDDNAQAAARMSPMKLIPGFKRFFTQTINGGDFLVYHDDEKGITYRFERGLGGPNVARDVIPGTAENEKKILEYLLALWRPNMPAPTTVRSDDGRFVARLVFNDLVEISERAADGTFAPVHYFDPRAFISGEDFEGGKAYHNEQQLRWRRDATSKKIMISQSNGDFTATDIRTDTDADNWMFTENGNGLVFGFDRKTRRMAILEKNGRGWKVRDDLKIFKPNKGTKTIGKFVEAVGETGTGKDVILQTVSSLVNIEIFQQTGHADRLTDETVAGVRSKTGGKSGFEPSTFGRAMHYGALFVMDERQKLKPEVFNAWKAYITDRTHKWPQLIGKTEQLITLLNSPLARFITTANPKRPGIQGTNWLENNPIMQERKEEVDFVWQSPTQEAEWQTAFALKYAKKLGTYDNDWPAAEMRIRNDVNKLVQIAAQLRLEFLGYDAQQQAAIFNDWTLMNPTMLAIKMSKDSNLKGLFEKGPRNKLGTFLKRAPSPRVMRYILRHLIKYPKDREYRALSVVNLYYNFSAEHDPRKTYRTAFTNFESWDKDKNNVPSPRLDEESFAVQGDKLVITPKPADDGTTYWDPIVVPLHPDALIRQGYLPDSVKEWLKEEQNQRVFYAYLQGHALAMGAIFVGIPGTGKSTMKEASHDLLNGRRQYTVYVSQETRVDQVTFQRDVVGQDSVYTPLDVPMAMTDGDFGSIIGFEETTQGRDDMISFQNELLNRHVLEDPRQNGALLEGGPGFNIIHLINDPNSSVGVGAFPDDIIERCIVIRFDPLPPAKSLEYFMAESTVDTADGTLQINPRLLGEPVKVGGVIQKYPNGMEKYDGIIGLAQELNWRKISDKMGKLLPKNREVGYRVIQNMLTRRLFDRHEFYLSQGLSPQEIVFTAFIEAMNLEGDMKQKLEWRMAILDVFESLGLYNPKAGQPGPGGKVIPDAIDKLLGGDGIKVPALDLIMEPESGNDEIDQVLRVLQKNPMSSSVRPNVQKLLKLVGELFEKNAWERYVGNGSLSVKERWERAYTARRIYQVIKVIEANRFDPAKGRGFSYSVEDQQRLLAVIPAMGEALVTAKHWPQEIFTRTDIEDRKKDIEDMIAAQKNVLPQVNEMLLLVNLADGNKQYIEGVLKRFKETLKNTAVKGAVAAWNDKVYLLTLTGVLEKADVKVFKALVGEIRARIAELEALEKVKGPAKPKTAQQRREDNLKQIEALRKSLKVDKAQAAEQVLLAVMESLERHFAALEGVVAQIEAASRPPAATGVFDPGAFQPGTSRIYSAGEARNRKVSISPDGRSVLSYIQGGTELFEHSFDGLNTSRLPVYTSPDKIVWAEYSPDGQRMAVLDQDGLLRFLDSSAGEDGPAIRIPGVASFDLGALPMAIWSPDSRRVSVLGNNYSDMWEINAVTRQTGRSNPSAMAESPLVYSPDGQRYAWIEYVDPQGVPDAWPRRLAISGSTRPKTSVTAYQGSVGQLLYSHDSRKLITIGNDDGLLMLWDAETAGVLWTSFQQPPTGFVVSAAVFSPDDKFIIATCGDGTIRVLDAETGKEVSQVGTGITGRPLLSLSADGRRIVVGDRNGVKTWEASAAAVAAASVTPAPELLQKQADFEALTLVEERLKEALSEEGLAPEGQVQRLLLAEREELIQRLGLQEEPLSLGAPAASTAGEGVIFRHDKLIKKMAVSSRGFIAMSDDRQGTWTLYDPVSKENEDITVPAAGPVESMVFSRTGRYLALRFASGPGFVNRLVLVWDIVNKKKVAEGYGDVQGEMEFASDEESLTFHTPEEVFDLFWGPGTAAKIKKASGKEISSATLSPDGRQLAVTSKLGDFKVTDGGGGVVVSPASRPHNGQPIVKGVFSPSGRWFVTIGDDHEAIVWDTLDWHQKRTLDYRNNQDLEDIVFSPDSRTVLMTTSDGGIFIWDVAGDNRLIASMTMDEEKKVVRYSPDGKYIAYIPKFGDVSLRKVHGAALSLSLAHSVSSVTDVGFSPDSKFLITAHEYGTVASTLITDNAQGQGLADKLERSVSGAVAPGGIDLNVKNFNFEMRANGPKLSEGIAGAGGIDMESVIGLVPVIISVVPAQWPAALSRLASSQEEQGV